MAAFIRNLMAQKAYIEQLEATLLQIKIMLIGGDRFINNNGHVIDRGESFSGFSLDAHTGLLKASGAEISGDIHANNGTFRGDLFSGVLFSSNQQTGENLPSKTFTSSQTAKDVYDYYNGKAVAVSGSWGNNSGVFALNFSTDQIPVNSGIGLGSVATRYILDILIFNGTTIRRTWADASGQRNTLGSSLIIDGGKRGPIFRLNLPEGGKGLQVGDVYRDSAGFIRVRVPGDGL